MECNIYIYIIYIYIYIYIYYMYMYLQYSIICVLISIISHTFHLHFCMDFPMDLSGLQ